MALFDRIRPKSQPDRVNVSGLAQMLGVSESTIKLWAKQGLIPPPSKYTPGGHRRWDPRVVLRAVERHQRSAAKRSQRATVK